MAKIKTRDAVKGTIKTIDKAAVASERMKSAYTKTKDKAEQSCYAEENSATEYAADKVSHTAERVTAEGVYQFDKQGQKSVRTTKENIVKAKDKAFEFKQKRMMKTVQSQRANAAGQNGSQFHYGTVSRSSASNTSVQRVKGARQTQKTIKQSARNSKNAIKTAAKGTRRHRNQLRLHRQPQKLPLKQHRLPLNLHRQRQRHLPRLPRKRHRRHEPRRKRPLLRSKRQQKLLCQR